MRIWQRALLVFVVFAACVGAGAIYLVYFSHRFKDLLDADWQDRFYAFGLIAVPLVLVWSTFGQEARRPRIKIGTVTPLARGPRGMRAYLRDVPGALRAGALVFLIGALCRPVVNVTDEKSDDKGIDIVIVMDLSGSMRAVLDGNAEDVPGAPKVAPGKRLTRIDTAKAVVKDFIGRRKSDRIGLVVFGKEAYVLSPPTLDYHLLTTLVSKLDLNVIDNSGTAIGDAVLTATARLRRSDAQSKVIVLLTDGDNNAGDYSPDKAAATAKHLNCKLFAIQIGNDDEVDVEEGTDLSGNPRYRPERFPVNPELLKRMAESTGGQMYIATDGKQLVASMNSVLDQLEKTRFEAPRSTYEDLFPLFLWPGVFLVGLDVLLRALLLRRFP